MLSINFKNINNHVNVLKSLYCFILNKIPGLLALGQHFLQLQELLKHILFYIVI